MKLPCSAISRAARRTAPSAAQLSEEHFLPLFVAAGAGGAGRVLHRSFAAGGLSMAAYAFGG